MVKKSIAAAVASATIFSAGVFAAGGTFSDVPAGSWFSEAANWANDAGLITGREAGQFSPEGNVTRAELAVVLKRYDDHLRKMDMQEDEMMDEEKMMDEEEMDGDKMEKPADPITSQPGMQAFKVTVKNTSKDQVLSPGAYVVHTAKASIDFKGKFAPVALRSLAEWGDPTDFAEYVARMDGVADVHVVAEPIAPGEETSFVLEFDETKTEYYLSGIQMAVGSNDGYAIVSTVPFYDRDNMPMMQSVKAMNYDNGTEENSELNSGFDGGQPDPAKGEANMTNGKVTLPLGYTTVHPQLTETIMEVMIDPAMPMAPEAPAGEETTEETAQ